MFFHNILYTILYFILSIFYYAIRYVPRHHRRSEGWLRGPLRARGCAPEAQSSREVLGSFSESPRFPLKGPFKGGDVGLFKEDIGPFSSDTRAIVGSCKGR